MKTIPLTQGKQALVDDSDYEELSKHKWFARTDKHNWYAARKVNNRLLHLHRQIVSDSKNQLVDHRDGDELNNQRSNLRVCECRNNMRNTKMRVSNKSGFKGVCWRPTNRKWISQIRVNDQVTYLGSFDDKVEAAKAYDRAAETHYGEFARTNKMMGLLEDIQAAEKEGIEFTKQEVPEPVTALDV